MQDTDVMMDFELAKIMDEAYLKEQYGEVLFVSDSCSAFTFFDELSSPNL